MVSAPEPISTADIARHYDQLDRFYLGLWGEHVHHGYWKTGRESAQEAARAMVDLVIARAKLKPDMDVLDVGCGYGATALVMARECGVHVTGVTISSTQRDYAEKLGASERKVRFFVEDWLHNQQPSASYDAVIAMESTEHMPDKDRVFAEMARVLKPGGRMVVVAWLAANHRTHWQDRHLIEPICRDGRLVAVGTPSEYRDWISGAGLVLEEERDISAQVSQTWTTLGWRYCRGALRHPSYLWLVLQAWWQKRIFAGTMLRIWLAYRLEAMRMIVFTASKPG
jgi:tocopherol O-methyltransferase